MSFTKFLTSRVFFWNLIVAIIIVMAILIATMQGLKNYTRHGQSNPVPDFSGMTMAQIEATAKQHNLKFEIVDSIHVSDAEPGAVVEQVPDPGFGVKANRTVFLTINSSKPERVILPKLTDISFRQALVLLENTGINVGKISYRPSEYNDLVLDVEQDSVKVKPNQAIIKGSSVDLIVGRSVGNEETILPDLTGFDFPTATQVLTDAMLNNGVMIYDTTLETAEDSALAFVWKQDPNPQLVQTIRLGSSIDLWFTTDSTKIQPPADQPTENILW